MTRVHLIYQSGKVLLDSLINPASIDKNLLKKLNLQTILPQKLYRKIIAMTHAHQMITILVTIVWTYGKKTFKSVYPVWIYLLKVNNRNTRTRCEICMPLASFWSRFWTCFTHCSSVSIVNFEHVIADWVSSKLLCFYCNQYDKMNINGRMTQKERCRFAVQHFLP